MAVQDLNLQGNALFTGLVGASVVGAVLYLLRQIPAYLGRILLDSFTVSVVVTSDDAVFDCLCEWFADHGYAKRARRLKVATRRNTEDAYTLAPGFGWHALWDHGLVLLERSYSKKSSSGGTPGITRVSEQLRIITLGRSQARVREIVERANTSRADENRLTTAIWHNGWWQKLPSKRLRSLDSVVLPLKTKSEIVSKVKWFLESRDLFQRRGVPYRYGVLLHGAPGTGKSSLVAALGGHFALPIYIINLSTVENDNALISAFLETKARCIVLLEDVDCIRVANDREVRSAEEMERKGITLSGLLNAIDGVSATEDRVLFMTTNHRDRLDPALIRASRVDLDIELRPLTPDLVAELAERFAPGKGDEYAAIASGEPPTSAAVWQQRLS